MSDRNRIYVYFDHDTECPERLGVISVQSTRGKESRWKTYANAVGIPRSEQEAMATAFHY